MCNRNNFFSWIKNLQRNSTTVLFSQSNSFSYDDLRAISTNSMAYSPTISAANEPTLVTAIIKNNSIDSITYN
jgi:hypothetical protein